MTRKIIKIKRMEVVQLTNMLKGIEEKLDANFTYFVYRNIQLMRDEYESIQIAEKSARPTERYTEFQQKRFKAQMDYCMKNSEGGPLQNQQTGEYIFANEEMVEKFKYELSMLSDEYSEDIVMYDGSQNQIEELREEEIELEVLQVKYTNFPIDKLPPFLSQLMLQHFTSDIDELEDKLFSEL